MKKIIILLGLAIFPACILCRGFGESFGGSFLGGFSGSMIGNAISQPRRSECSSYRQPTQTRIVEVHRPTYVQVEKPRKHHTSKQIDQKLQELEAKSHEADVKKLEAELAKAHAENEQLKLRLIK